MVDFNKYMGTHIARADEEDLPDSAEAPLSASPAKFSLDLDTDLVTPQDAVAAPLRDDLPLAFQSRVGYLTGPAGSGKTYLCKQLESENDGWRMAASTGIAAVNLGGTATTINALLGYFDEASLITAMTNGFPQMKLRKLRASGLKRILLDEISMISAETLRLITHCLDEINEDISTQQGRTNFVDITVVGDFCQLPPVEKKGGPKVGYAFQSNTWPRYAEYTTTLNRIWRQSDPAFVEGLRAARRADKDAVVAYFGPRCVATLDDGFDGLTVLATNADVDRWNWMHHDRILEPPVTFPVERKGQQKTEWNKYIGHCGVPGAKDELSLRPGAQVMVLANAFYEGELVYSNGDLGKFLGQNEKGDAVVQLKRSASPMTIERIVRHNEEPTGAKGTRKQAYQSIGHISYMPLRLAFASTVHKVQGISCDNVQVHIANRFFGAPSMLYVALSRARTIEGLRLVGTPALLADRCSVDARVLGWL